MVDDIRIAPGHEVYEPSFKCEYPPPRKQAEHRSGLLHKIHSSYRKALERLSPRVRSGMAASFLDGGGFCLGLVDPVSNVIANTLATYGRAGLVPGDCDDELVYVPEDKLRDLERRSLDGMVTFLTRLFPYLADCEAVRFLLFTDTDLLVAAHIVALDLDLTRFGSCKLAFKEAFVMALNIRTPAASSATSSPSPPALAKLANLLDGFPLPTDGDHKDLRGLRHLIPTRLPPPRSVPTRSMATTSRPSPGCRPASYAPAFHRSLLEGGHSYGPFYPVSNIIVNTIWYDTGFTGEWRTVEGLGGTDTTRKEHPSWLPPLLPVTPNSTSSLLQGDGQLSCEDAQSLARLLCPEATCSEQPLPPTIGRDPLTVIPNSPHPLSRLSRRSGHTAVAPPPPHPRLLRAAQPRCRLVASSSACLPYLASGQPCCPGKTPSLWSPPILLSYIKRLGQYRSGRPTCLAWWTFDIKRLGQYRSGRPTCLAWWTFDIKRLGQYRSGHPICLAWWTFDIKRLGKYRSGRPFDHAYPPIGIWCLHFPAVWPIARLPSHTSEYTSRPSSSSFSSTQLFYGHEDGKTSAKQGRQTIRQHNDGKISTGNPGAAAALYGQPSFELLPLGLPRIMNRDQRGQFCVCLGYRRINPAIMMRSFAVSTFDKVAFRRTLESAAAAEEDGNRTTTVTAVIFEAGRREARPLCCTPDMAKLGVCIEGAVLYPWNGTGWPKVISASSLLGALVAAFPDETQVSTAGKTIWKNSRGHLPSWMAPLMPFYGVMSLAFAVLAARCTGSRSMRGSGGRWYCSRAARHVVLPVFDLAELDESGAATTGALRGAVAHVLIVTVSMGHGESANVASLGAAFFAAAEALEVDHGERRHCLRPPAGGEEAVPGVPRGGSEHGVRVLDTQLSIQNSEHAQSE
ncbi:hypothetical protein HU200_019723 [Digitaria exilis]|uniref:PIR2-like helical domain-containing protein n=1 Tax=Digitaria exilis TaxID=1010633 RepID=A0A835F2G5_9POAL|nr:hypothetical protein HU200_019723 [Digitaria exilis]